MSLDNIPNDDMGFNDALPPQYTIEDVITALETQKRNFSAVISYGLSDVSAEAIQRFSTIWGNLAVDVRRAIAQHLLEVGEANFEMDYRAIAKYWLQDSDATVRETAIEMLWEDESIDTMRRLSTLVQNDAESSVRAAALSSLGNFILLGEYGKIARSHIEPIENLVADVWQNRQESVEVRRRALEALSNGGHMLVPSAIQEAYTSKDLQMQASALYAMGKTCDEQWATQILASMRHQVPQIRYEATKASGELQLADALPKLAEILRSDEKAIQEVAIWSLGEIGGQSAIRILNQYADSKAFDEDFAELIDDAIATAELSVGLGFSDDLFYDEDEDE